QVRCSWQCLGRKSARAIWPRPIKKEREGRREARESEALDEADPHARVALDAIAVAALQIGDGIAARAPGDVAAHADAVARLPVHAHTRPAQGHVVGRLGPEENRSIALDMALVIKDGGLQRLIELVAPFRGHQPAAVAAGLAG